MNGGTGSKARELQIPGETSSLEHEIKTLTEGLAELEARLEHGGILRELVETNKSVNPNEPPSGAVEIEKPFAPHAHHLRALKNTVKASNETVGRILNQMEA